MLIPSANFLGELGCYFGLISASSELFLFNKLIKVTDKFLDVTLDYIGAIPYDEFMKKAIQKQKPVVNLYPRCPSSMALSKYVEKACKWPVPDTPNGHIEFFLERLYFGKNRTVAQLI